MMSETVIINNAEIEFFFRELYPVIQEQAYLVKQKGSGLTVA